MKKLLPICILLALGFYFYEFVHRPAGLFKAMPDMSIYGYHNAELLENGLVKLKGHDEEDGKGKQIVEVFDYRTNRFTRITAENQHLLAAPAKEINRIRIFEDEGKIGKFILMFPNGLKVSFDSKQILAFPPHSQSPIKLTPIYPWPTKATPLKDGKILLTGGLRGDWTNLFRIFNCEFQNGAEIFDPITLKFQKAGTMIASRYSHNTTLLPNGSVLITGGRDTSSCDSGELLESETNSTELYVPASLQ
jgi:hypothetical protein